MGADVRFQEVCCACLEGAARASSGAVAGGGQGGGQERSLQGSGMLGSQLCSRAVGAGLKHKGLVQRRGGRSSLQPLLALCPQVKARMQGAAAAKETVSEPLPSSA